MLKIKEKGVDSNAGVGNILDDTIGIDTGNPKIVNALRGYKSVRFLVHKSRSLIWKINLVIDDVPNRSRVLGRIGISCDMTRS